MHEGTNYTERKPEYEGEIVNFTSPYNPDVILTDIAERDRYGRLVWVAYIPGKHTPEK